MKNLKQPKRKSRRRSLLLLWGCLLAAALFMWAQAYHATHGTAPEQLLLPSKRGANARGGANALGKRLLFFGIEKTSAILDTSSGFGTSHGKGM